MLWIQSVQCSKGDWKFGEGDQNWGRSTVQTNKHTHTHTLYTNTGTDLSVLPQVGPHAGAISAPHEYVVGEVVDARQGAGELASGGLIVVAHIGDHVIKLEHLAALVLFAQPGIEGYLGAVQGGHVASGPWTWGALWTWLTPLSWGAFSSLGSGDPWGPSESCLCLSPSIIRWWRWHSTQLLASLGGGVGVAHHPAATQHLIMGSSTSSTSPFGRVDQQGDGHQEH